MNKSVSKEYLDRMKFGWMADIIVTHNCNRKCQFCCDEFIHESGEVDLNKVDLFLENLFEVDGHRNITDVMILGGEPTLVSIEKLQAICNKIHSYNVKVSMTTNNRIGPKLLELNGFVDYMNISYYIDTDYSWIKNFDKTQCVISKLITKTDFPELKDLDNFISSINVPIKLSTLNNVNDELNPAWLNDWQNSLKQFSIFTKAKAAMYNGVLVKLMGLSGDDYYHPKLYPNGNWNRTWHSQEFENLQNWKEETATLWPYRKLA
jgi:organic radical activating enzyme